MKEISKKPQSMAIASRLRTRLHSYSDTCERGLDTLWGEGHLPDARAGRVEYGVSDCACDHGNRGFTGSRCGHIRPVQQHDFNFRDRKTEGQRVVSSPVD